MCNPNGQNPTLQVTKQPQHMEVLRHAEKSARDKSMATMDARLQMDQQTVNAMSEGLELMRQLNIQQLGSDATAAVSFGQLTMEKDKMSVDVQKSMRKREESKMKERDQKKAAAQRLASRTDYRQPEAQQLAAVRSSHIQNAKEHPITETDWKKVRVSLSGDEFSPDPHTGDIDAAAILEKQRILKAKVQLYEKAKKNGTISPDEEIMMETNKEILKLFTDATRLWFTASGMDVASGKALSDSKKKAAQKELGFALEKYHEFMASVTDTMGQRYISRLQKAHKKDFDRAVKEAANADKEATRNVTGLNLNLPRLCKDDIDKIRHMTAEHPQEYQQNKALVDKIYHEYLSTAETYNEQMQPLRQMQNLIQRENHNAIANNSMAGISMRYLEKQVAALSTYQKRMEHQLGALSFLLAGKGTENLVSAVYMKQQWGITPPILESAEADEDVVLFRDTKASLIDNIPAEASEREVSFREKLLGTYAAMLAEARLAAENAPEDSPEVAKYRMLQRAGLSPKLASIQFVIQRFTDERLIRRQAIQKEFGALKFQNAEGQIIPMTLNSFTRDTVNMVTPLLGETTLSIEEITEIQERVHCLTSEKHLDDSAATEDEQRAVFLPEYERMIQTAAETKAFADAHPETFHNPGMTHEERLGHLPLFQETYQKMQTLCYISIKYYELAEGKLRSVLTDEQRAKLADAYEVFRCMQDVCNDAVVAANARNMTGKKKEYREAIEGARARIAAARQKFGPQEGAGA